MSLMNAAAWDVGHTEENYYDASNEGNALNTRKNELL